MVDKLYSRQRIHCQHHEGIIVICLKGNETSRDDDENTVKQIESL